MVRVKMSGQKKINCEQLVVFSYCLFVLVSVLNSTQFHNILGWSYIAKGIKIFCLGLVSMSFLMQRTMKTQILYIGLALSVTGMGVILASDKKSTIVMIVVFFMAGYCINSDKIFQQYVRTVVGVILFTLLLYAIGIYHFDSGFRADGVRRLYLGFTYTTFLANYFFHVLLVYFVIKNQSITILQTVIIILINFIIYRWTDTKAVYYEIYLLLLLLWILRIAPSFYQSWLFKIGTLGVMPTMAIMAIWLSYIYTPSNLVLLFLDQILSSRLYLGHMAIERYGFTLLGNDITWVTGRYGIERMESYFYVDSSYLNMALSFGIITLILVVCGFVFLSKRALKEKQYVLCIALIMLAVHSFSDPQLFSLQYDPFLILIGTAVFRKAPLPLKTMVYYKCVENIQ